MIWDDRPPTWQPTPEEYYQSPFIGSGSLNLWRQNPEAFGRQLREKYMALAYGRVVAAEKMSSAMILGSAVDCLVTEPGEFRKRFSLTDSKRVSHTERHKLTLELYVKARKMAAALRRHDGVRRLIIDKPCLRQMCHTWQVDGIWYRLRADFVAEGADGDPVIPDIKCWAVDARDKYAWIRHAQRLGTFHQMALYEQGIRDLWGKTPAVPLLIVSSKEPHYVVLQDIHGAALDDARREVCEAQKGISEAFKTRDFRGRIDEGIRPFLAA